MALKILHRNHISFAQASGNSSVDYSFLTSKYRFQKWITDSPATSTTITGVLGGATLSPGISRTVKSIAICHKLPLDATVKVTLYDGVVSQNNIVYEDAIHKPIMPDLSGDGVFDSTDLDVNGLPNVEIGFNDYIYMSHLDVPLVATDFRIELTYSSAVIPIIKNVYVGDCFVPEVDIDRTYSSYFVDSSRHIEAGKNLFSDDGRKYKAIEFNWSHLTDAERIQVDVMCGLVGRSHPVYVEGYKGNLKFGPTIDRVWGVFDEQPKNVQRSDRYLSIWTASGRIVEH